MTRLARLLLGLLLGWQGVATATPQGGGTTTLHGIVTHVTDGDTLWLRPDSGARPVKLRLLDIDAPEICQAGGRQARQALADLTLGRPLRAELRAYDDYGRGLARLTAGGVDVNERMVRDGQAWAYRFRGRKAVFDAAERDARGAGRGLFADPRAMPPREFRRVHGACERDR